MPILPSSPNLAQFQIYLREMVVERGFAGQPTELVFMRLLEEVGELAKAARNCQKQSTPEHTIALSHEAVDVFIYLLDICNRFDIDLEQAFREKEALNKKRFG